MPEKPHYITVYIMFAQIHNNMFEWQVSLEFVQSGRRSSPMRVGGVDEGVEDVPGSSGEVDDGSGLSQTLGVGEAVVEGVTEQQGSPIRIREKDVITKG